MQDVLLHGDCLELLKTLESNSVDSLCCDPPAGISFMGKDWDNFSNKTLRNGQAERDAYRAVDLSRPGYANSHGTTPTAKERRAFIDFMTAVMAECLRVVKPGGHALVWALPRTSHWTATALEDAGWEIRDVITHTFGSGFPKSHNISAAIDKMQGAERQIIGHTSSGKILRANGQNERPYQQGKERIETPVTLPATPDAQRWSGYGSALKPASEHWILARKPLAAANLASNVLAWGTGGLNIDASRVQLDGIESHRTVGAHQSSGASINPYFTRKNQQERAEQGLNPRYEPAGRWPPNFLLSHADCSPAGCSDDCPVAALDEQAGERKSKANTVTQSGRDFRNDVQSGKRERGIYDDQGNCSRFFPVFDMPVAYFPKASRRERNAGCEALPVKDWVQWQTANGTSGKPSSLSEGRHTQHQNIHPTVKSLALMSWLVRLITPPNGTVLDCFAGSGSTLVACVQEGFHFIGMEQDASYITIAQSRIAHAQREQKPAKPRAKITRLPKRPQRAEQLALFA